MSIVRIKVKQVWEREVGEQAPSRLLLALDKLHKQTGDSFELIRRNNKLIIRRITR